MATVTVSPQSASIEVGGQVQMSATARDASGTVVSATASWTITPTSVASISSSGLVTGVSAGTATATATVGAVQGTAPVVVEAPAPETPTGLTAAAVSSSSIDLTWEDNSDDETGFRIERSPDGESGWGQVATTEADVTSYRDDGLAEGTRYVYRVAAVRDAAVSDWSEVADATTLQGTEGTIAGVEAIVEDVLPPPGTPLEDRNLLDEVRAVADRMADLPGVDTVIVLDAELSVETLLDDGTMHLFINSRPAGASTYVPPEVMPATRSRVAASPAGTSPPPALRWRSAVSGGAGRPSTPPLATDGPPGSRKAVVVAHDGGAEMALKVREMVSDAGYQILPLGASLEDMRQYKDLGVLHLDTHGVAYKRLSKDEDGTVHEEFAFALQTSTVATSDLTAYHDDVVDGLLAFATTEDEDGNVKTKIAITDKFIAKYWSFDDGVVMLHACYGGGGPGTEVKEDDDTIVVDPNIVRLAMLGAGARIVVAFDNLTWWSYAEPSVLYFFDRVLGADSYEPEDPPLRPFDIQQVHQAMQEEGLLLFHRPAKAFLGIGWGGNDVNVVFDDVGERATLAPSIRTMDVVDDAAQSDGRLTLNGLFGDEEGTVEVEGVSVPVESWAQEQVVARIPFQGSGSAGPVVVKRPDQVKSNEVPLTEWRSTVTVTTKVLGTSLQSKATLEVRFRADVHAFRDGIMDEPRFREVPTWVSPASTGTNRGSGSYTNENGATETWYGEYDMDVLPRAVVEGGVFSLDRSWVGGSVRLDPDGGKAEICLGVWGQIGVKVQTSQGTQETTGFATFIVPDLVDRMRGLFGCVNADLDDDTFVIDGGDRSTSTDDASFSLTWTDFYPFSPPDDETPG